MTEPSMPTAMRPSTLSFDEFLTNNTSHKYVSDTPNPTIMNPRTAARSHSKSMIATLHTTMQPKLLKLADMFHDAFIKLYNYEEQLEKFQNNSDYIPASARINLSHKDHYHEDIRGGSETKSLDEETSAIVRDCQRDLAHQIHKATLLNQAAQKMTLLKILSDFLLHSATGFLTLYNVSKIDKNYSAHQAISDMMFCFGQGVLYSLFVDATPTEFVKAYNASTKHHLPLPTKIDIRSIIDNTKQHYFNPYLNVNVKDRNARERSYVPSRSTPAYDRKSLGSVAGLSYLDFEEVLQNIPDDPWCVTGCTTEKPPANVNNSGIYASPQSTSTTANNNVGQEESTDTAADDNSPLFPSRLINQLIGIDDETKDEDVTVTDDTVARPHKRARQSVSDDIDEEALELHGNASQLQQNSEDDEETSCYNGTQGDQNSQNSQETNESSVMSETNDIETVIPVKDFLIGLGKEKSRVVSSLHWLITTAFNGSINLYVETDNLKTKNLEMKKVMEAVDKGRTADDTLYKYSKERSADTPLLRNVVETVVNKKMNTIKASVQSIAARTNNNNKMKNVQPQDSRKTSKRDSKKSLKEQRGAQPTSKGAALQKKKKSNRNRATPTPTPTPKSIMKSTINKAALKRNEEAGGSNGGTKTEKFASMKTNSKQKSGKKKKSTKTKKNNKRKASMRT